MITKKPVKSESMEKADYNKIVGGGRKKIKKSMKKNRKINK